MTNSFKKHLGHIGLVWIFALFILSACNPTEITSSGQRAGTSYANGQLANTAFVYRDSPYIIEGPNYGPDVDMAGSTDQSIPEFITDKPLLQSDCVFPFLSSNAVLQDCVRSYASKSASQQLLPRKADGTWIFPINSPEFYQVNTLFHVNKGISTFYNKLKFTFDNLYSNPSFVGKTKSTPAYLPQTGMFWFQAITPANENYFRNSFLSTYALCNFELNSQFSPAEPELCFGNWAKHPTFLFVQDPSVIYHELGHALIAVMMNYRNGRPGSPAPSYHALRSNLGGYGYEESGSIGEGVADYFSFVMTKRTHFAEWALSKVHASRPISESDPLHISALSETPEGRLSYPQYILYDPNDPNVPIEDVHYAGQIVSHYLVALTKSLQSNCSIPTEQLHDTSTSYVMMLLNETFSELGDLNAVGLDTMWNTAYDPNFFAYRFTNLDENASYLWSQIINPPTYRKFFQILSKNINRYITGGLCTGFTQDESEKLLDDYGLLLFKTYNNDGSSTKNKFVQYSSTGAVSTNPTPVAPTQTHENNRRKSVLVSKELLGLAEVDTVNDVATFYIIDDQANMTNILKDLLFKGFPVNLSTGVASTEYNNANIKVSPGEIVGIIPNLKNKSNSVMAGIHLLATDWDHGHITDTTTGNFKPCVYDDVTTAAQGGETAASCTNTLSSYNRNIKLGTGLYNTEAVQPVCLVQIEDGDVTRWVSQNEFRKKQGLSLQDKDCLGYGGNVVVDDFTFNPHECLVRALPGANSAYYSKIDPQKSYAETIRTGNPDHIYGPGNAILFEVNKWIPPGTKFRCRLRAKFSNCSDCFNDPTDSSKDDYIDAEYNGQKPFKIINFDFDVND